MHRSGMDNFYETSRDRRQKFSHMRHQYTDFGVLLGNWFEERARTEAETEVLLHKMSQNQLGFQKLDRYLCSLSKPLQLTRNLDGFVHHADIVRLKYMNPTSNEAFFLAALPFNIANDGSFQEPCLATAASDSRIMVRCAFHVFRNKNQVPNHIPLMYGECILICTAEGTGQRLLNSEPKSFATSARKSGHNEVTWVKELSGRSLWKVLHPEKSARRRSDGKFIPSNAGVIIRHLATGENLAFENKTTMETVMGLEKEVSVHSYFDRNKLEENENIWQFEAPLINSEDYGEPIHLPPCKITECYT